MGSDIEDDTSEGVPETASRTEKKTPGKAPADPSGETPLRGAVKSKSERELEEATAKFEEAKKKVALEKERAEQETQAAEATAEWEAFIAHCKLNDNDKDILQNDIEMTGINDLKEFGIEPEVTLFVNSGLSPMKAKRISNAARYVSAGGKFTKGLDFDEMKAFIQRDPMVSNPGTPPNTVIGGTTAEKDPGAQMTKATVGIIDPFGNDPVDFEDYWDEVEHILGATWSGHFLTNPANPTKSNEEVSNRILYHVLANAFRGCTVEADISKAQEKYGKDGYKISKAITSYYRSSAMKSQVQKRLRTQLKNLKLTGDPKSFTDYGAYLSDWQLLYDKLKAAGEVWDDNKKREEFLDGINLDGGNPVQQTKVSYLTQDNLTFAEALSGIDKVARKAFPASEGTSASSSVRRTTTNDVGGARTLSWNDVRIPPHVISKLKKDLENSSDAEKAVGIILRWRKFFVEERRQPTSEEMSSPSRGNKRKDSTPTSNSGTGGRAKSRRVVAQRMETTDGQEKQVSFDDGDPTCGRQYASTAAASEEELGETLLASKPPGDPKGTVKVMVKDSEIEKALAKADADSCSITSQNNNDNKQTPHSGEGEPSKSRRRVARRTKVRKD